jgi:hypothetical protein
MITNGKSKTIHPPMLTSHLGVEFVTKPVKVELPKSSAFQIISKPITSNTAIWIPATAPPAQPAHTMRTAATEPEIIFFQE